MARSAKGGRAGSGGGGQKVQAGAGQEGGARAGQARPDGWQQGWCMGGNCRQAGPTWRQQTDDGALRAALRPHALHGQRYAVHVPRPQGSRDEVGGADEGAVLAQRPAGGGEARRVCGERLASRERPQGERENIPAKEYAHGRGRRRVGGRRRAGQGRLSAALTCGPAGRLRGHASGAPTASPHPAHHPPALPDHQQPLKRLQPHLKVGHGGGLRRLRIVPAAGWQLWSPWVGTGVLLLLVWWWCTLTGICPVPPACPASLCS